MKTKLLLLMMVLTGSLIFSSCTFYPDASEATMEDLVVFTQYDTKADFSQYQTFAVSDEITKVTDKDTTTISGSEATACLEQIILNMEKRGYVLAAENQLPDLGLDVVYYQNTNIYAYTPYYYWGYPYYGWGYYYPYYPVYYSTYTTGTLSITMMDLKNPGTNNSLDVNWNAFIRGLLNTGHTLAEITHSIDQAFIQTPQITK